MGVIARNEIFYGAKSKDIIELTQAEYDSLPDSKKTDDILYAIKDGDSESIVQNNVLFTIDLDNKLETIPAAQEITYTATQPCYARFELIAQNATTPTVKLNGKSYQPIFIQSGTISNVQTVLLLTGDTLQVRQISDSFTRGVTIYAIKYENIKTPTSGGIDYSTEEQETGQKWIDGRKIYQRTFIGNLGAESTYSSTIAYSRTTLEDTADIVVINSSGCARIHRNDGDPDFDILLNTSSLSWQSKGTITYSLYLSVGSSGVVLNGECVPGYIYTFGNQPYSITLQYVKKET